MLQVLHIHSELKFSVSGNKFSSILFFFFSVNFTTDRQNNNLSQQQQTYDGVSARDFMKFSFSLVKLLELLSLLRFCIIFSLNRKNSICRLFSFIAVFFFLHFFAIVFILTFFSYTFRIFLIFFFF